jgi:hypothetical protein
MSTRTLVMNSDEVVRDMYAHVGLAMYQAQVLEHSIVNAMVVARMPERDCITTELSGGRPSAAHRERAQALECHMPSHADAKIRRLDSEPTVIVKNAWKHTRGFTPNLFARFPSKRETVCRNVRRSLAGV